GEGLGGGVGAPDGAGLRRRQLLPAPPPRPRRRPGRPAPPAAADRGGAPLDARRRAARGPRRRERLDRLYLPARPVHRRDARRRAGAGSDPVRRPLRLLRLPPQLGGGPGGDRSGHLGARIPDRRLRSARYPPRALPAPQPPLGHRRREPPPNPPRPRRPRHHRAGRSEPHRGRHAGRAKHRPPAPALSRTRTLSRCQQARPRAGRHARADGRLPAPPSPAPSPFRKVPV
ncbi:MAG: hypothetical protein AVDCRST_MAG88-758, partial [uncultured Thermomicrobiales bacterium]